jgi:hypothetical protein
MAVTNICPDRLDDSLPDTGEPNAEKIDLIRRKQFLIDSGKPIDEYLEDELLIANLCQEARESWQKPLVVPLSTFATPAQLPFFAKRHIFYNGNPKIEFAQTEVLTDDKAQTKVKVCRASTTVIQTIVDFSNEGGTIVKKEHVRGIHLIAFWPTLASIGLLPKQVECLLPFLRAHVKFSGTASVKDSKTLPENDNLSNPKDPNSPTTLHSVATVKARSVFVDWPGAIAEWGFPISKETAWKIATRYKATMETGESAYHLQNHEHVNTSHAINLTNTSISQHEFGEEHVYYAIVKSIISGGRCSMLMKAINEGKFTAKDGDELMANGLFESLSISTRPWLNDPSAEVDTELAVFAVLETDLEHHYARLCGDEQAKMEYNLPQMKAMMNAFGVLEIDEPVEEPVEEPVKRKKKRPSETKDSIPKRRKQKVPE